MRLSLSKLMLNKFTLIISPKLKSRCQLLTVGGTLPINAFCTLFAISMIILLYLMAELSRHSESNICKIIFILLVSLVSFNDFVRWHLNMVDRLAAHPRSPVQGLG